MKDNIKNPTRFDEHMIGNRWESNCSKPSAWDNVKYLATADGYHFYVAWDNEDKGSEFVYRNKVQNVCKECGKDKNDN